MHVFMYVCMYIGRMHAVCTWEVCINSVKLGMHLLVFGSYTFLQWPYTFPQTVALATLAASLH